VRAFGAESFEERRFEVANTGYFRAFTRLRRVSAAAKPLSEYAIILVAVAIAWMGSREVFEARTMPPERLFTFVAALLAMLSPVKGLSEVGGTIATGLGAADRVWAVLDTPPAIRDAPGARALEIYDDGIGAVVKTIGIDPATGRPFAGKRPFGMAVEERPAASCLLPGLAAPTCHRIYVGSFTYGWVSAVELDPSFPSRTSIVKRIGAEQPQ